MNDILIKNGGVKTPSDLLVDLDIEERIESAEQTLESEKMALELARIKQETLENYIREKTTRGLTNDVAQKRSVELAKQAAWELQMSRERKLERSIAACTLIAPADGLVVYANDPSRLFGSKQPQIEEGATVRERQKILSLPDLSQLQVSIKLDESQVNRVVPNMKARISVESFPDQMLNGRVLSVAPLPDPMNSFAEDQKVYTTKVGIANRLPGLRPGMSAQVEIRVDELDNVISVPVKAISRIDGKEHVAVATDVGKFAWREVSLGMSNGKFVEIKQGLQVGEWLALDAQALMNGEKDDAVRKSEKRDPVKPADPAQVKVKAKAKRARVLNGPMLQKFRDMSAEDRARLKSASPEKRAAILKEAGFTEDELRQVNEMVGPPRPNDEPKDGSDP